MVHLQMGIEEAQRLRAMMQEDCEDMRGCINGELLDAYLQAMDTAEGKIETLCQQLVDLQARQMPGL